MQYKNFTLDGDFAESVIPKPYLNDLMADPLGIKAVTEQERHFASNRFFSHWIFMKTFRTLPLALQSITNPIDSVYLACAICKIAMHISLLILLTIIITGETKFFKRKFILVAAFLSPFFQGNGFVRKMGLIDPSMTYSFFYAMPAIFLLLYFLPLILELFHGKSFKMNWFTIILWILLAFLICFSGPLNPGVVLIVSMILLLYKFIQNFTAFNKISFLSRCYKSVVYIPKKYYLYLIPISLLALYSLYVGSFNSAGTIADVSVLELYKKLPRGIFKIFTSTPWVIIILLLLFNYLIIGLKYKDDSDKRKLFLLLKFVLIFSIIYILLLPLGGYREYRPYILRYDTIIPITLFAFILIGATTLFLLKKNIFRLKLLYPSIIVIILAIFVFNDKIIIHNICEKESMKYIAQWEDDVVMLTNNCAVISWIPYYTPEEGYYFGELLYLWRITDRPKLYYNQPLPEN